MPTLSPFLFTPSLYVAIFNLSNFIFNALAITHVVAMVMVVVKYMYVQTYMAVCTTIE